MNELALSERATLRELALFAGAGGGILGGMLHGWRTVAAVEIEDYPRRVLLQRQADGILPRFPVWDDVCTFDGKPWRGKVDVITGGFPCQDISAAGRGAGIGGSRSGLWAEMARIIGEVRPRYAFVENSPLLVGRGLAVVLGDLASLGYDARWGVLGAVDIGAPHTRDRAWIVADNREERGARQTGSETHGCSGSSRGVCAEVLPSTWHQREAAIYWPSQPEMGRVADGLADWMGQIAAIGNGQCSAVAAAMWTMLNQEGG